MANGVSDKAQKGEGLSTVLYHKKGMVSNGIENPYIWRYIFSVLAWLGLAAEKRYPLNASRAFSITRGCL